MDATGGTYLNKLEVKCSDKNSLKCSFANAMVVCDHTRARWSNSGAHYIFDGHGQDVGFAWQGSDPNGLPTSGYYPLIYNNGAPKAGGNWKLQFVWQHVWDGGGNVDDNTKSFQGGPQQVAWYFCQKETMGAGTPKTWAYCTTDAFTGDNVDNGRGWDNPFEIFDFGSTAPTGFIELVSQNEGFVLNSDYGQYMTNGIRSGSFSYNDPIKTAAQAIAASNILGVTVYHSLFTGLSQHQFSGGVLLTSSHPTIHSRIERVLGAGNATVVGCNVLKIGIPNVRLERIQLDNSGCIDEAMAQIASGAIPDQLNPDVAPTPDIKQLALNLFDGDDLAVLYLTQTNSNDHPTGFTATNVQLNTNQGFRIMFPGRPTLTADNRNFPPNPIDLDGMYLSNFSETFSYEDERDSTVDAMNLKPLVSFCCAPILGLVINH